MLVDTNVWAELSRPRPDVAVAEWIGEHFDACILSTIVLAEMLYGIELADSPAKRRDLRAFHDDLLSGLSDRIVTFDQDAAGAWAPLRARLKRTGTLIAERDMLIAAHAISLDVPLLTRNVLDMARTGATIINPWQA